MNFTGFVTLEIWGNFMIAWAICFIILGLNFSAEKSGFIALYDMRHLQKWIIICLFTVFLLSGDIFESCVWVIYTNVYKFCLSVSSFHFRSHIFLSDGERSTRISPLKLVHLCMFTKSIKPRPWGWDHIL